MLQKNIYGVIGIGIGPFNLGLAALLHPVEDITSIFFDQNGSFNWHPGIMLENATLQVPFMADLVTMADPSSPFSFLQFLKEKGTIYRFYIRENFFIFRKEYNAYCQWVAAKLSNCHFGKSVVDLQYVDGVYKVSVKNIRTQELEVYFAEKIVLGTGTSPSLPPFIERKSHENAIHTSDYLYHKDEIAQKDKVTIVGSGQSAAEIFRDLLPLTQQGLSLHWYTRSSHFFPLDNRSKLTLELTSPEYADHFHTLPFEKRADLLSKQSGLYKGIDQDLINELFEKMYELSLTNEQISIEMRSNLKMTDLQHTNDGKLALKFTHSELEQPFNATSDFVILATGYKYTEPSLLQGISDRIDRLQNGMLNVHRNYAIDKEGREVFVQNAELHTHGLVTPDLGMGAYRNSYIINQLLGRTVYPLETKIAFQQFGVDTDNSKEYTSTDAKEYSIKNALAHN